jgi:hypothetical protein
MRLTGVVQHVAVSEYHWNVAEAVNRRAPRMMRRELNIVRKEQKLSKRRVASES